MGTSFQLVRTGRRPVVGTADTLEAYPTVLPFPTPTSSTAERRDNFHATGIPGRGQTRQDAGRQRNSDAGQCELQGWLKRHRHRFGAHGDIHDAVAGVEDEVGVRQPVRDGVVVALAEIPPGNLAMYYPEANVLVPRRIDRDSGTPAFKSIVARVKPI